jgi:hypothetical protein
MSLEKFLKSQQELNEKMQKFYSAYKEIENAMTETRKLIEEGNRYDSPKVYDAAKEVLDTTEAFLTLMEDLDENMDADKTNIPSVDYLFEGLPITEFVDARIKMALGDESKETKDQLIHAAEMINHDSFCNKACCPDTCVCGKDFTQYEGTKEGAPAIQFPEGGELTIGVAAEDVVSFTFPEYSIYEYVESISNSTAEEINTAMSAIDEALKDVDVFSAEDVQLVRFYLSNLPSLSDRDVEGMTDMQACYKFQTMQSLRK